MYTGGSQEQEKIQQKNLVFADEDNNVDLLSKLEKLYTNMRNISEKKKKTCQQPSTPPPTEPHGLPKCQRPLPNNKR